MYATVSFPVVDEGLMYATVCFPVANKGLMPLSVEFPQWEEISQTTPWFTFSNPVTPPTLSSSSPILSHMHIPCVIL